MAPRVLPARVGAVLRAVAQTPRIFVSQQETLKMNAAATSNEVSRTARRPSFVLSAPRIKPGCGIRHGTSLAAAVVLSGLVALPANAKGVQATPLPQPMESALVANDGYLIVTPLHPRHMSAADLVCAGAGVYSTQGSSGIECRDNGNNKPVKPVTVQQALDSDYGAGGATIVGMSPYTYGDVIVYYRVNKKQ